MIGIELKSIEVKSIRAGFDNINNAFARNEKGQAFVDDVDMQKERASERESDREGVRFNKRHV